MLTVKAGIALILIYIKFTLASCKDRCIAH